MSQWNNLETLDHFRGHIWISKSFKENNRGNVCVLQNGVYRVLAYISPQMIENQNVEKVIYGIVEANGTLWMLEDENLITCSICGKSYNEDQVNIVDYVDDCKLRKELMNIPNIMLTNRRDFNAKNL